MLYYKCSYEKVCDMLGFSGRAGKKARYAKGKGIDWPRASINDITARTSLGESKKTIVIVGHHPHRMYAFEP